MKMIKLIFTAAFCLSALGLFAEEQAKPAEAVAPEKKQEESRGSGKAQVNSLFGGISFKNTSFGGYGALESRFAKFRGSYGMFAGGKGALVINHGFEIGGAGYGLVSGNRVRSLTDKRLVLNERADIGYGGLFLGYHFFSKRLFSFSLGSLVGSGVAAVKSPLERDDYRYVERANRYFIAEPELYVYINIFEHCRLGLGGSYRFVRGMNKRGVTSGDLAGPSVGATLQFGVF